MSRIGSGGVLSAEQAALQRKARLREIALQSINQSNDPYLYRNHTGTIECRLCLTIHSNEGNYLSHSQGRKHQANLARRAIKQANNQTSNRPHNASNKLSNQSSSIVRIGRPGYRVIKQFDPNTQSISLLFAFDYDQIDQSIQPRTRFMSIYEAHAKRANKQAIEQSIDAADQSKYQYLIISGDPYNLIAFRIPNQTVNQSNNQSVKLAIDRSKFLSHWDAETCSFIVQIHYLIKRSDNQSNEQTNEQSNNESTHQPLNGVEEEELEVMQDDDGNDIEIVNV